MNIQLRLQYTSKKIQQLLSSASEYFTRLSLDDTMHTIRVYNVAIEIGKSEGANLDILALGALLHDIGKIQRDSTKGHASAGVPISERILKKIDCTDDESSIIIDCVAKHQIKNPESESNNLEVQIIQDADLIDELGAIGIIKCVSFHTKRSDPICLENSFSRVSLDMPEMLKKSVSIVDHFYDKLLILDRKMNTIAGRNIAQERIEHMKGFLKHLKGECQ